MLIQNHKVVFFWQPTCKLLYLGILLTQDFPYYCYALAVIFTILYCTWPTLLLHCRRIWTVWSKSWWCGARRTWSMLTHLGEKNGNTHTHRHVTTCTILYVDEVRNALRNFVHCQLQSHQHEWFIVTPWVAHSVYQYCYGDDGQKCITELCTLSAPITSAWMVHCYPLGGSILYTHQWCCLTSVLYMVILVGLCLWCSPTN